MKTIVHIPFQYLTPIILSIGLYACLSGTQTEDNEQGLTLKTSDAKLLTSFEWAKQQALFYAHDENDPVGKWYEAALPKREAFCMRDVAHQTGGANPLGLKEHNKNMLYKFAVNISESKDWCTYWEINRYNNPAPVDYVNDKEFWYNLPANFDVLDACYRQYLWTGDKDYITDSVFLNFYSKTVNEYVERWQLSLDKILTRDRFMHTVKPMDSTKYFHICRGLPGYAEDNPTKLYMGSDMFGIMYLAFNDYAAIQDLNGNVQEAEKFRVKAKKIYQFFNNNWWNAEEQRYYVKMLMDSSMLVGRNRSRNPLRTRISQYDNRFKNALDNINTGNVNVEGGSYLPKIFYDYDRNEKAYASMMDLANPNKQRREYPEVSYGVIEGIVSGMLGLYADAPNNIIMTLPHLTKETEWVEVADIPILNSKIIIKHQGNIATTLTNQDGRILKWKAGFPGVHEELELDGKTIKAIVDETVSGAPYSWVEVLVESGKSSMVKVK